MKLYQLLWFVRSNAHITVSCDADGFMWTGKCAEFREDRDYKFYCGLPVKTVAKDTVFVGLNIKV